MDNSTKLKGVFMAHPISTTNWANTHFAQHQDYHGADIQPIGPILTMGEQKLMVKVINDRLPTKECCNHFNRLIYRIGQFFKCLFCCTTNVKQLENVLKKKTIIFLRNYTQLGDPRNDDKQMLEFAFTTSIDPRAPNIHITPKEFFRLAVENLHLAKRRNDSPAILKLTNAFTQPLQIRA